MNGSIRFFQALYFCIIHLNLKDFIETEFGMSLKFGTSGLRGLSVDLKGKASAVYATAFARHLLTSGQAKAGDPFSWPAISGIRALMFRQPASPR